MDETVRDAATWWVVALVAITASYSLREGRKLKPFHRIMGPIFLFYIELTTR